MKQGTKRLTCISLVPHSYQNVGEGAIQPVFNDKPFPCRDCLHTVHPYMFLVNEITMETESYKADVN